MAIIQFKPLYKERVWGGRGLATKLGREDVPGGPEDPIGESWEVVDRPEDQSVITTGPHAGKTLREAIQAHPAEIMGAGWPAHRPFPILVKWLDCRERLSLQVHPPAMVAAELNGEPKTENWYIAESEPDAGLLVGLKKGVDREQFEKALKNNQLEALVHRIAVQPGDSMFVYSGRLHAIDAGNLILEIQQNSDTTYRVYDWGRMGTDGNPRELHVDQSLKSTDFDDFEPEILRSADLTDTETLLAEANEFRIRRLRLDPETPQLEIAPGEPRLVHIVEGRVLGSSKSDGRQHTFERGDNLLLPATEAALFEAKDNQATLLITDQFNR